MKALGRTLCSLPLAFFISSANAALTTYNVSGIFSNTVYPSPTGNPESYPFPDLFGGSFQGSFSFDLDERTSHPYEYSLVNVSIGILDKYGATLRTITNTPVENNTLRYFEESNQLYFVFGYSYGTNYDLNDLRLTFFNNLTSPVFNHGHIATDGPADRGWALALSSTTLTHVSGPVEDLPDYWMQAPIPAGAWLFGSALLGLAGMRRRKAS